MDQLLQQVLAHLRGMWNRRMIGLAVAWAAAIVGVVVAFRIPEKYESSARIHVDTQSLLRPVMAGLSIQPNLDQQVALISRTLLSRPNVEKLVDSAHLDAGLTTEADRAALIDNVTRSLQINGSASTNLYVISYRGTNPQQAKDVVEALLNIFVEATLGDKRQDTRTTLNFLDEQISRYEQSLQSAENRLKEFRLKYLGVPGQGNLPGQDFFSRMSKASDDIENAKLELRAAVESRDSYRRELTGQKSSLAPPRQNANSRGVLPELDARIAAQKTKLDELLRNFTEQHPDVVGTRRVIVELEEQRRQELLALEKAAAGSGKSFQPAERNPVFEQLQVSLADAEAKVASLQARLASYEGQYAQLKSSARLVPEVEAELAQLNRDYDIQKKTYGDLLARREAATIGSEVQNTEGTQFHVIDPPRVSSGPVQPTRIVLLAAALAGALGAGLLASFVANELVPTFHDGHTLHDVSQRPVLGMLSLMPNESVRRKERRRLALFVGGLGSLITSFGAVLAVVVLAARAA